MRVRDTGVGIPPEMLPRVFDLFTQVDRSLARSEGGLGIGLTLVKRLVEMHGGTRRGPQRRAGPGQRVRRPAAGLRRRRHAPDRGHGRPGPATGRPPPRRVLVVDDNVDAAESLAMLLRVEGHEVRTAHDGPTALRSGRGVPPRGRPAGHRPAADGRLRGRPAGSASGPGLEDALLVALTGYGQEEDRRRSHEAGFDGHLVKPADPAALRGRAGLARDARAEGGTAMTRPSPVLRYGVSVLAVAAAMLVRWPLWPVLHGDLAFLFLWPVVILCAWYGGLGPGLLATALSALSAAFFLLEPRSSFAVASPADLVGLAVFVSRERRRQRPVREAAPGRAGGPPKSAAGVAAGQPGRASGTR